MYSYPYRPDIFVSMYDSIIVCESQFYHIWHRVWVVLCWTFGVHGQMFKNKSFISFQILSTCISNMLKSRYIQSFIQNRMYRQPVDVRLCQIKQLNNDNVTCNYGPLRVSKQRRQARKNLFDPAAPQLLRYCQGKITVHPSLLKSG